MVLLRGNIDAFREVAHLLTRHRDLTLEMARREISDRYAGQAFGLIWAVGHPLFLMGLFVFIFAIVFKARVGGTLEMPLDYTTYLLSGLIPWMGFQESLSKSCTAITANASLVKQVVFPLEILPAKGVLASMLSQVISLCILLVYVLLSHGSLFTSYALLPFLFALQIIAMLGVAYILSSLGAYFRDIKDFVQLFCTAGVYLMPVFYLPGWIPKIFIPLLYLNPFSYLIWCYQDVIYFGRVEHPYAWVVFPVLCLSVFVIGYRLFRKLKPGFGNIL
jgi:lipopolysaccharide transport system permease protein